MPNDTINLTFLISTLLGGGVLGALITQFFSRAKTRAEANKTEAEAERTKAETAKILTDLGLKPSTIVEGSPKELKGWIKAGSEPTDYEIGVDQKETYHGKFSAYIKSRKRSPRGFGTLMQTFKAVYAGKRLKMSGCAKSEGVEEWAGFWMRVDGPDNKLLSFDNMQDRPIKGTTGWTKYQSVLDVPDNSVNIAFGVLLNGPGRVWVSDIQFEVVSTNDPTTDRVANYPDKPVNLNFDE